MIQAMTDPTCLGILIPPGLTDIDIFVAEGQSFGIIPSFGGPGLGIFTAKQKYLRKMPGRLVGKTKEINGDGIGFILTLQAREQHIRREKASSNICTNQALCSLSALVYLLSLGKTGLKEIALQNFQKAHFVKKKLRLIPGLINSIRYSNSVSVLAFVISFQFRDLCRTPPLAQFLCQVQILILEILGVCLRLEFSPSLNLNEIKNFSKVSVPFKGADNR